MVKVVIDANYVKEHMPAELNVRIWAASYCNEVRCKHNHNCLHADLCGLYGGCSNG